MSKAKLTISGLKETQKNLLQLPNAMAATALDVVNQRAQEVAKDLRRAYPRKTGNLRRSVVVEKGKKSGAKRLAVATSTVRVTSPVAHLIEDGTVARHTSWGPEYGDRGMMYGLHIFWPRILALQRELLPEYIRIVKAQGFKVSGSE